MPSFHGVDPIGSSMTTLRCVARVSAQYTDATNGESSSSRGLLNPTNKFERKGGKRVPLRASAAAPRHLPTHHVDWWANLWDCSHSSIRATTLNSPSPQYNTDHSDSWKSKRLRLGYLYSVTSRISRLSEIITSDKRRPSPKIRHPTNTHLRPSRWYIVTPAIIRCVHSMQSRHECTHGEGPVPSRVQYVPRFCLCSVM